MNIKGPSIRILLHKISVYKIKALAYQLKKIAKKTLEQLCALPDVYFLYLLIRINNLLMFIQETKY